MGEDRRRKAEEKVKKLKSFYSSLISYGIVNLVLMAINFVTSPDALWFYWVSLFWGIALLFQAAHIFILKGEFLSKEWEEKKIQEIMDKG